MLKKVYLCKGKERLSVESSKLIIEEQRKYKLT